MVDRRYVGTDIRNTLANILVSIDAAINDANKRLNTGRKSKLIIERKNQKIYLKGTLPIIPIDGNTGDTKRYWLSYGNADLKTVGDAEVKCRQVDTYLRNGGLDWWLLLPSYQEKNLEVSNHKNMATLKLEFANSYWLNRPQSRKTLATWEKSYEDIFKKIPNDELLTESNILKWIEKTEPDSKPRLDLIRVIKCLAEQAGIKENIDWYRFKCQYKPRKRSLPTDGYIEAICARMPQDIAWAFGMIATYGLRPSELFQLNDDLLDKFTSIGNERHILYIPQDTKTGERAVYPLHPEWVDKFNLLNVSKLKTNAKKLETKISWLNKLFHRYGFNQPAYDLRHRYAIRASELGVLIDIAAKWMGHSVEEHYKTYQRWMEISTHNKVFDRVVQVKEEMTEIEKLKLENQLLRDEVERLKMLLKDR
jgi:integrase